MEWVEVTGRTVGEATESALEQLGIVAADAEVIVLTEPRTGLFGRLREEARVRARVRPVSPRPKRNRRPSRTGAERRGGSGDRSGSGGGGRSGRGRGDRAREDEPGGSGGARGGNGRAGGGQGAGPGGGTSRSARRRRNRARQRAVAGENGAVDAPRRPEAANGNNDAGVAGMETESREEAAMPGTIPLEEQAAAAREFLSGLVESFGLTADISSRELDEDTIEVAADGADLGLLIGPRGATLASLQDLTRTAVQHRFPARTDRILVDVAGYRQRRISALQRFTQQIAQEVTSSGEERALEPMSAADRKVVHDTVNELDGVATRSEGDDPARYVVIAPGA